MKKRIISLAITLAAVLGLSTFSLGAAPSVTEAADVGVIVAGKEQKYAQPPIIVDGSTFLPLRALAATLGIPNDDAHIAWNGADKSVTLKSADGAKTIRLKIGNQEAKVNGAVRTVSPMPALYKNSTYIPLRFAADALDMTVLWDAKNRDVYIRSSAEYELVNMVYCSMRMKMPNADGTFQFKESSDIVDTNPDTNAVISKSNEHLDCTLDIDPISVSVTDTVASDDLTFTFVYSTGSDGLITRTSPSMPNLSILYSKDLTAKFMEPLFDIAWIDMKSGKQTLASTPIPHPKDDGKLDTAELVSMYATLTNSNREYELAIPLHLFDRIKNGYDAILSRNLTTYVIAQDTFIIKREILDTIALMEKDGVNIERKSIKTRDFMIK